MRAYLVKTPDGYLYPFANDASLTDRQDQAGRFGSATEARETAERLGYYDDKFEIIAVDIHDDDASLCHESAVGIQPRRISRAVADKAVPADPDPDDPVSP